MSKNEILALCAVPAAAMCIVLLVTTMSRAGAFLRKKISEQGDNDATD